MNNEQGSKDAPAGLYRDPESGRFIGCLDDNQAAAAIRAGYRLVAEGTEAAMTKEADYESFYASLQGGASDSSKKGK